MRYVIEGLIGSGKSKLCTALENVLTFRVLHEPIEQFTLLKQFYENPKEYSYLFQKEVQDILFELEVDNSDADNLITERWIGSTEYFSRVLQKKGYLTKQQAMEFVTEDAPEVIIRMVCSPETAFKRVQLRAREEEKNMTLEYLQELDYHLKLYLHKCAMNGSKTFLFYNDDDNDFASNFQSLIRFLCGLTPQPTQSVQLPEIDYEVCELCQ